VKTDPVLLSVLQSRMKAITEEMAAAMLRTAHTVFVKETQDFGAVLVSTGGEVFAAPVDTAVSTMAGLPCGIVPSAFDDYEPGDVVITNDPDLTRGLSTHLPDIWMWKPIFADGRIVAFAVTFIHSSDIGGKVPGSISPSNGEIYQEGLRIPLVKLFKAGVPNQDVIDFLLLNTRIPEQQWGDFKAQVATLNTAEKRVHELVARYGTAVFETAIDDVLDLAEAHARKLVAAMPDGDYHFTDYLEADHVGAGLIRIQLALKVRDTDIELDFTGTDYQVQAALNLPSWNQRGHRQICIGLLNYFRTLDPSAPYNSGLVRPLKLSIPEGTLLNPDVESAYGVRAATMYRVLDIVMGALAQAVPGVIPAAGAGGIAIVLLAGFDPETGERKVEVAQPLSGGSGARPSKDGIDGVSFAAGFLRNVPNEVLESDMPVLVERYGYRDGSPGAGRWRGGSGMTFALRMLGSDMQMTARGLERFTFRPWGLRGGQPGALGQVLVNPGTQGERDIGKIDVLALQSGDVVEFRTASGGGIGLPSQRPPERVLADVAAGLIDPAQAEADYGVIIVDGSIDRAATDACRASMSSSEIPVSFGPEREAYEERWTSELSAHFRAAFEAVPSRMRPPLVTRARRLLDERKCFTADDIDAVVADLTRHIRPGARRSSERRTAFEALARSTEKGSWQ
jgi:N-methylhydantoinase B